MLARVCRFVLDEQAEQLKLEQIGHFGGGLQGAVGRLRLKTKHGAPEHLRFRCHGYLPAGAEVFCAPKFFRILAKDLRQSSTRRVYTAGRIGRVGSALAGLQPGQERDTLVDRGDRIDRELAGSTGLDHVTAQHQVLNVGFRYKDALIAGEAARLRQMSKKPSIFSLTPPIA